MFKFVTGALIATVAADTGNGVAGDGFTPAAKQIMVAVNKFRKTPKSYIPLLQSLLPVFD